MEVCLKGNKGVPADAIISIRSGAVRRQGVVSSGRPFRFPKNASETDCVVKIDLMKNIGSGYLVLRPHQKEGKQYQVLMNDSPDMMCEVEVKPLEGDEPALPEQPEDAGTAAKTKDAKAYMEDTGLLQFVQGVLQVVVKQQPDDPYGAMAKHFLSGYECAESGSTKLPQSPKKMQSTPASPKAVPEESTEEKASPPEEVPAPTSPQGGDAPAENVPSAPASPKAEESGDAPTSEQPGSPKAEESGATETPASPKNEAGEDKTAGGDDKSDAKSDAMSDQKSDALEEVTAMAATVDLKKINPEEGDKKSEAEVPAAVEAAVEEKTEEKTEDVKAEDAPTEEKKEDAPTEEKKEEEAATEEKKEEAATEEKNEEAATEEKKEEVATEEAAA